MIRSEAKKDILLAIDRRPSKSAIRSEAKKEFLVAIDRRPSNSAIRSEVMKALLVTIDGRSSNSMIRSEAKKEWVDGVCRVGEWVQICPFFLYCWILSYALLACVVRTFEVQIE